MSEERAPEPSVLAVHAHPDDEALWTGGLLATHTRASVVTCTWAAGTQRVEELERSLEILGAGEPRLLGYADMKPESAPGRPRFRDVPFDMLVERVVEHIRDVKPDIVATYDAYGGYGHPDHILVHRVTLAAVEAAGHDQLYRSTGPAWRPSALYLATLPRTFVERIWQDVFGTSPDGQTLPGVPDARIGVTLDIREVSERKWAAIQAHRSEIERGGSMTMITSLPEHLRNNLLTTEWYLHRD